jgi:hypothetical protein
VRRLGGRVDFSGLGPIDPAAAPMHGPTLAFALLSLAPIFVLLFLTTAWYAAIYTLSAQAPLHWLRWTSPLAFALGGAASAYVLQAINALGGGHVTVEGLLVGVLGGALCGFIYRMSAGVIEVDDGAVSLRAQTAGSGA